MNELTVSACVFGPIFFFAMLFLVVHFAGIRRALAEQKWAGTIHAAILHARATKQNAPSWLEGLEDAFLEIYKLTHGNIPTKEIVGRGVADMANIIGNHLFTHDSTAVAEVYKRGLMTRDEARQMSGPSGDSGPTGTVEPIHDAPREPRKPLRSFSIGKVPLIVFAFFAFSAFCSEKPAPVQATVEAIAFAPNSSSKLGFGDCDCTNTVVDVLSSAKKTVIVQAYNFTSEDIAKALIAAHKRGVDVQIVGDRSVPTERSSQGQACVDAGIKVLIDKKHHIAHNKVIVVDGDVVITGSFNWTESAENNNAENLLVIRSDKIAAIYTANWKVHAEHSEPFGK